mgnify:CR=1 FL=1
MSRGFPVSEYEGRVARAQARMAEEGLGALLLTTEPEVRYFTGFLTRFWESPSRPWFLVVPAEGKPIAVIPSIGAALMASTWVEDIRTWAAPAPDDDGVSLLADALREVGGPVGVPSHLETHLRMPLSDFARVQRLAGMEFTEDRGIVAGLRAIKSAAEIGKSNRVAPSSPARVAAVRPVSRPLAQIRVWAKRGGVQRAQGASVGPV